MADKEDFQDVDVNDNDQQQQQQPAINESNNNNISTNKKESVIEIDNDDNNNNNNDNKNIEEEKSVDIDNNNNNNNNNKTNNDKYQSINLIRPQRTASPRILKIISTEERKGRVQKHTVYIIEADPSPPGVITVARRYNDFKWLRGVLCQLYPGLFVPPLPPANVIGRFENSFIEERRQDLERYIYNIFNVRICDNI